jgi:AraC-like DNA-binding protein
MNTFKIPNSFEVGLKGVGIDPAMVLRRSGLPLNLWSSGKGMVTTEQFFGLWRALGELSNDPAVGLKLPAQVPVEQHNPASIAAFHARTFRDALQRFARYKILCCFEEVRLLEAKGECAVDFSWILSREPPPFLLLDAAFMSVLELGRRGTRRVLHPLRVELRRNADHQEIYEASYGCRVKFQARRDAIFFRSSDLDLPFVTYNAELLEMLTPQLDRNLAQRKSKTYTDQVKWVLKRLLGGHRPEITEVAKELGMSSRTLQRRITDERTSFRQLLSEARRELARYYLQEPSLGVGEIAYLLSYEDPSSFFRAFHEWEGKPPREWRANQRRP